VKHRTVKALTIGAILTIPTIAMAGQYSPPVPFENVQVGPEIIGGVYVPSHMQPMMVQPSSIPFRLHRVNNTERENESLNALAASVNTQQEDDALADLQQENQPKPISPTPASPAPITADSASPLDLPSLKKEKYHITVSNPSIGATNKTADTSLPTATAIHANQPQSNHIQSVSLATAPGGMPEEQSVDAAHIAAPQIKTSKTTPVTTPKIAPSPTTALQVQVTKTEQAPKVDVLIDHAGESLSTALSKFLKAHHWHLQWLDPVNFTPAFTNNYSGNSVTDILREIKNAHSNFHFSEYTVNRVVVVTPFTSQLQNVRLAKGE